MTTIKQLVAQVYDQFVASGEPFMLKEVVDTALEMAKEQEDLYDEGLRRAIEGAVKQQDSDSHRDDQLVFGAFSFGATLNIGVKERQSVETSGLTQLLADDEFAQANFDVQRAAWDRRVRRTRALTPYLLDGVTIPEAVAAWRQDHPDEPDGALV